MPAVKYTDLVEAEALVKVAEDARVAISVLNELISKQKLVAGENNKPSSGTGAQKKSEEDLIKVMRDKITVIEKSDAVHKEYLQTQVLLKQATKNEMDATKGLTSAYQELQNKKNAMEKLAKDSAARELLDGKQISAKTQQLIKDSAAYNNSLKQIDYTLGNHQRNVGNYNEKLGTLSKSLKGFGALGGMLTRAIGVDPEAFMAIKEAGMALKDIRHISEGTKLAKEGEAAANIANTEALVAETAAQEGEAAAAALSTGGILLLVGALITAGAVIYEYITAAKSQEIIDNKLRQLEQQRFEEEMEHNKKRREALRDQNKTSIQKMVDEGKITVFAQKRIEVEGDAAGERALNTAKESLEIKSLSKTYLDAGYSYATIQKYKEENIKGFDLITKKYAQKEVDVATERKTKLMQIAEEEHKQNMEDGAKAVEAQMDFFDKKEKLQEKKELESKKSLWSEEEKFLTDLRIKEDKERDDKAKNKKDAVTKEIQDSEDAINKAALQKRKNEEQAFIDDEIRRKKRIDEEEKMVEQILSGIESGLKKREELEQASDQKQIDFHTRTAEIQATLAAGGKDNSLASEQAATAKAEEKKIQDAKKAAKQQEAIALIETFSKVLSESLKNSDGTTGGFLTALAKASAADGLVKAAFSRLFTGYKSGIEGIDGEGTETSDSIPALLSKNESVVTAKGTKENPGLATAMNKGKVDDYFEKMYLPQYNASNTSATSIIEVSHDEKLAKIIDSRFDSLQKTIENKPVHQAILGSRLGEWTDIVEQNMQKIIVNHKRSSGKRSLRLNG